MDQNTRAFPGLKIFCSKTTGVDPVPLDLRTVQRIEEAKKDIKNGNVFALEELKAELGLE